MSQRDFLLAGAAEGENLRARVRHASAGLQIEVVGTEMRSTLYGITQFRERSYVTLNAAQFAQLYRMMLDAGWRP